MNAISNQEISAEEINKAFYPISSSAAPTILPISEWSQEAYAIHLKTGLTQLCQTKSPKPAN